MTWNTSTLEADRILTDRSPEPVACTGGYIAAYSGGHLTLIRPASKIRCTEARTVSIDLRSINMEIKSCSVDVAQDVLVLCGRPSNQL